MSELLKNAVWEDVDSSNIREVAFDEASETILVKFKGARTVWAYSGCSRQLYEQFRLAPSVGKFFNANIKSKPAEQLA